MRISSEFHPILATTNQWRRLRRRVSNTLESSGKGKRTRQITSRNDPVERFFGQHNLRKVREVIHVRDFEVRIDLKRGAHIGRNVNIGHIDTANRGTVPLDSEPGGEGDLRIDYPRVSDRYCILVKRSKRTRSGLSDRALQRGACTTLQLLSTSSCATYEARTE